MHKISRYISGVVTASILLVLTVLMGLDSIASMIDEMGELDGRYDFLAALKYVLFSMPGNLFELLPFAALVGCLAGLGTLANNSELVVIRSAGITTLQIVWMVMRPALVILFFGLVISEYIAPSTESIAQSERATALRKSESVVSKEGLWHREGDQFMHFNVVQPNGVLYGVTIYTFDQERDLKTTLYAERAIYQQKQWLLEDVTESVFDQHGGDEVGQNTYASRGWASELSPSLLNILVLDPIDLPILELWQYASYLSDQGLNSDQYQLAFWEKVLQPLSTVSLVLVAISFIFGPLREVTMGYRIFIGVLVGVVFRTAQDMLSPASMVYGFAPIYASLIPILVCLAIGVVFLRRAH